MTLSLSKPTKPVFNRRENGTFGPGNVANPEGRPKRKTLTERIHERLDSDPNGWDDVVNAILALVKDAKDKDMKKELWHYTDGTPVNKTDLTSKGEKITIVQVPSEVPNKYEVPSDTGTGSEGQT